MPKSQYLITIAFAAGVLLTDQFHRLASLSKPMQQQHSNDFEFLPIELIRALNQTEKHDAVTTPSSPDSEDSIDEYEEEATQTLAKSFDTQKKFP